MVRAFQTTRQDAINEMLSILGEAPVNSVGNSDQLVNMADNLLDGVEREIQAHGWHFNREQDHVITKAGGIFPVGPDWIRINDAARRYSDMDLIIRKNRVWDLLNRTDNLRAGNISEIKLNVVLFLDFDETPETFRRWLMMRAGRMLHDRLLGSARHHGWFQADEDAAWLVFNHVEILRQGSSIFTDPFVRNIISRGRSPLAHDEPLPPGLGQGGHPPGDT